MTTLAPEELWENTVEGRIVAYFDFMFSTAVKYLSNYQATYGLDVTAEAQDITQEAVRKTLEADAYGPSLGANYFRTVVERLCNDFIDSKKNERIKTTHYGYQTARMERTDRSGWLTLADAVKRLPEAERVAVAERYMGYKQGELSGSQSRSSHALKRARKTLAATI